MDLSSAEKKRLGLFVVFGLSVLLISILWLLDFHLGEKNITYRARFYDSINGLDVGAGVSYRGLRIGHVSNIQIDPNDKDGAIEVFLLIKGPPLHEGTAAMLDTSGMTGVKSVNIIPGDPKKPLLPPNAYIDSKTSFFDSLTSNAGSIMTEIQHITQNIAAWTTEENRIHLEKFLHAAADLSQRSDHFIQENEKPLHDFIQNIQKTSTHVSSAAYEATLTFKDLRGDVHDAQKALVKALEAISQPFEGLQAEDVRQIVHNLKKTSGTLQHMLDDPDFQKGFHNFAETLSTINELVKDVDITVRAGRQDFILTLSYIRQAAEDLREFSRMLAHNPAVLIRGREESAEE